MAQTTVRITEKSRATLKNLAQSEKKSMQLVLEQAIESYRRQRFLEQLNQDFAEVKQDKKAWSELKQDYDLWENTVADGLKHEDS
jgi:predicted transcriptional regulator